jgi:hypothetical protein
LNLDDMLVFNENVMRELLAVSFSVDFSSVEMGSFAISAKRRNPTFSKISVGFRVLVPEGQDLLLFSREVKFIVESGLLLQNSVRFGLGDVVMTIKIGELRAISPEGYICDEKLTECPKKIEVVTKGVAEKPLEPYTLPVEVIMIIVSSLLFSVICCGIFSFCYSTGFRHVKEFVNFLKTPSKPKKQGDETHENIFERPSSLRFENASQTKNGNDSVDLISDTVSVKSGKSGIKFSRVQASDMSQSDFNEMMSVRSAWTMRSALHAKSILSNTTSPGKSPPKSPALFPRSPSVQQSPSRSPSFKTLSVLGKYPHRKPARSSRAVTFGQDDKSEDLSVFSASMSDLQGFHLAIPPTDIFEESSLFGKSHRKKLDDFDHGGGKAAQEKEERDSHEVVLLRKLNKMLHDQVVFGAKQQGLIQVGVVLFIKCVSFERHDS